MKRCNKFMAVVAVILAFALTFTSVSVPAEAATTSVKSIMVKDVITVTVGQPVTGVKLSKTSLTAKVYDRTVGITEGKGVRYRS